MIVWPEITPCLPTKSLFFLYISTFSTEKLIINTLPHVENSRNHVENLFSLHKSSFGALFQVIQVPSIRPFIGYIPLFKQSVQMGRPSHRQFLTSFHGADTTYIRILFFTDYSYLHLILCIKLLQKIQNIKKKTSVFGLFLHR